MASGGAAAARLPSIAEDVPGIPSEEEGAISSGAMRLSAVVQERAHTASDAFHMYMQVVAKEGNAEATIFSFSFSIPSLFDE